MRKVGNDLQRTFDAVYRTHNGKSVTEVRAALSAALRRAGFTPSPDHAAVLVRGHQHGEAHQGRCEARAVLIAHY
ncbi:MAG TPA: hypothetical protein VK988_17235 [Acidimicrobiales bacterium]|nr:hypothetical protein [Acidimicrobiales bacterium]